MAAPDTEAYILLQPGLIKILCICALSVPTPFSVPYCTFRHSFKEKCPLSGAKTQVKYVNPGALLLRRYRYMLLCFITLLQEHMVICSNLSP